MGFAVRVCEQTGKSKPHKTQTQGWRGSPQRHPMEHTPINGQTNLWLHMHSQCRKSLGKMSRGSMWVTTVRLPTEASQISSPLCMVQPCKASVRSTIQASPCCTSKDHSCTPCFIAYSLPPVNISSNMLNSIMAVRKAENLRVSVHNKGSSDTCNYNTCTSSCNA